MNKKEKIIMSALIIGMFFFGYTLGLLYNFDNIMQQKESLTITIAPSNSKFMWELGCRYSDVRPVSIYYDEDNNIYQVYQNCTDDTFDAMSIEIIEGETINRYYMLDDFPEVIV